MGDSFVVADIISRESGAENGPGVCNIVEHFARITYSCFQPHDPFVFIEREEEREREGEREREREKERESDCRTNDSFSSLSLWSSLISRAFVLLIHREICAHNITNALRRIRKIDFGRILEKEKSSWPSIIGSSSGLLVVVVCWNGPERKRDAPLPRKTETPLPVLATLVLWETLSAQT